MAHRAPYSLDYDYSEDDMAERQPLGAGASSGPPRRQYQQQPYPQHPQYYNSPPSQSRPPAHQQDPSSYDYAPPPRHNRQPYRDESPRSRPSPQHSPQRDPGNRAWGRQPTGYSSHTQQRGDNYRTAAAGGMAGISANSADQYARENPQAPSYPAYSQQQQQQQQQQQYPSQGYYSQEQPQRNLAPGDYSYPGDRSSYASSQGVNGGPSASGYSTPGQRPPSRPVPDIYTDDPYQSLSRHQGSDLGMVDPNNIADDGDDGLEYGRRGARTSMLSLGSSRGGRNGDGGSHRGPAAVAGASTGGLLSTSQYAPVNSSSSIPGDSGLPNTQAAFEKAAMASAAAAAAHKKKKWKLAIIIAIAVLAIAGVVIGILFGVVFKKDTSGGGGSTTPSHTDNAEDDLKHNGDLDADSPEIKALMNNPDLKKVFVGMDYTPINSQYPECLTNPPSQNNVTRDLAVLSQLTNVVRLYGTDCNQTQMLIHAVNQLRLKDTVKIWLGVWQDNNATTNARQLEQMWDILDTYGDSYFKGIIVANEILFRQQMSATELGVLLDEVRKNLTARGINLPVATSDLGDKWDSTLASQSDAIMANIHPFFAGEPAKSAAAWTMLFWNNKVSGFLKKNPEMNIISETGWPTQGGMGCGNEWETDCPQKAVAGIEELNVFMEDFVCQALKNGTQYFWFEAFDEPWKVRFNTPGKEWEDHWGLLTVNRELKKGVVIPDCDGMRVD